MPEYYRFSKATHTVEEVSYPTNGPRPLLVLFDPTPARTPTAINLAVAGCIVF